MRSRLYEAMDTAHGADPRSKPKTRFLTQQSNVLLLGVLALVLMAYGWVAHSGVPADAQATIAAAQAAQQKTSDDTKKHEEDKKGPQDKKKHEKEHDHHEHKNSNKAFDLAHNAKAQQKVLDKQKHLLQKEKQDREHSETLLKQMEEELRKQDVAFVQADRAAHVTHDKKALDKAMKEESKAERDFNHEQKDLDKAIKNLKADLAEVQKTEKTNPLGRSTKLEQDELRRKLAELEGKRHSFQMHERSDHQRANREHHFQDLEGRREHLISEEHKHHDKVRKFRDDAEKKMHELGDILKREEGALENLKKLEQAGDKTGAAQHAIQEEEKLEKDVAKALGKASGAMGQAHREENEAHKTASRMGRDLREIGGGFDQVEGKMDMDLQRSLSGDQAQLFKLQAEQRRAHHDHDAVKKWLRR